MSTGAERTFRAWLAGFFDGEGSIGIYHLKPSPSRGGHMWEPKLSLYQKDERIIREVQARLNGYAHKCGSKRADHQVWSLVWTWRKAVRVARYLQPYLRVKRDQCEAFLAAMNSWPVYRGGQGRKLPLEFVAQRQILANSVNRFNAKPTPNQTPEAVHEADEGGGVTVDAPVPIREETT